MKCDRNGSKPSQPKPPFSILDDKGQPYDNPTSTMIPYRALSQESSEIRLFRFVNGPDASDNEAPIRLELRHASLDDNQTHYGALSYVWGETTDPIGVYIDGFLFEIGRNLHDALTQLRRSGITSWLWVDSICIQQSDVEEKTSQVGQMRSIYSQADLVYIWLGLGCDETDKTMGWISRIGPRALSSGALDLGDFPTRRSDIHDYIASKYAESDERPLGNNSKDDQASELARFILDLLNERGLHGDTNCPEDDLAAGIINLMQRDYWHRIWIVQEVSLGTNAMVLCGAKAVSLDVFDATLSAVSHCITSGIRIVHPDIRSFAKGLRANFYESVALTTRRHYRRRDQDHNRIHLADILFQHGIAPGRPHYSATDPRDILFGLLGVIPDDNRAGLEVDYSLDMDQVFSLLTKALIRNGDEGIGRFHLDSCIPRDRTERGGSLPSWVPDWREMGKYGSLVHPINYPPDFNAAAGIPAPALPLRHNQEDPLLLRRRGCRVAAIIEVMTPPGWHSQSEWTASTIVDAEAWLDSILAFTNLGADTGPGEDYIWRTVQLGRFHLCKNEYRRSPIPEDVAYVFRRIFRREPIDTDQLTEEQRECICSDIYNLDFLRPDLKSVDDRLAYLREEIPVMTGSVSRSRTLFKTNKGMLGAGHVAIRVGDIVTLLAGVQSPIILRPQSVGGGGGFTFVGDAYVDGIMDGEFMKTMPAFEKFEIY